MFLKKLLINSIQVFLCAILLLSFQEAFAQQKHTRKNVSKEIDDSEVPILVNKIETYNFTIDRDKFLLQRSYDVTEIEKKLPDVEKKVKAFKTVFKKMGQGMNLRSLNSIVILLGEIEDDLTTYKTILSDYSAQLTKSNADLKKIFKDTGLKVQVEDSTLRTQLTDVLTEGQKLNISQRRVLSKMNLLSSRVSVNLLQAKNLSSDLLYLSISKKINMWSREEAPLFRAKPSQYENSFSEITLKSFERSGKIMQIYLASKIHILVLSLFIFICLTAWIMSNMRRIKKWMIQRQY